MKFKIEHEIKGRLRIHLALKRLTYREADSFDYYLNKYAGIKKAKVYERTADAVIFYDCDRMQIINYIRKFSFDTVQVPEKAYECSSRELEAKYSEKIVTDIVLHYGKRLILPLYMRRIWIMIKMIFYIWRGLKTLKNKRLQVELLDTIAITAAETPRLGYIAMAASNTSPSAIRAAETSA